MVEPVGRQSRFPDAREDLRTSDRVPDTPQTLSPSYRLAFSDPDFLTREELRPVRLQLELLKVEMALTERGVRSTVALFGGARIPPPERAAAAATPGLGALARYYDEAREFARLCSLRSVASGNREGVICSGGGPGVMEAANRGALDAGGISISLNIVLPHEQVPNLYGTPELSFNFHYFAIRKMHFLTRAKAIAIFPGGFGTLDEMFEALTLVQTKRMKPLPILLFGGDFWRRVIDWRALVEAGTISPADVGLMTHVDTAAEAMAALDAWTPPPVAGGVGDGE
ncbi:LOG family protein [Amaricoccus sp.]|uniref:LOG family protein n=1 Tax=Amaricoccus sp. TaxID=1872485 RepID=UPI001B6B1295|nr:LOG family protein [Amaricoccus sp.]MBP7003613.1 LOG family protein [Amaricoccus sp.]